ncbi:MAG: glycerophosphodiester phosphodiesterase [Candidatus Binatia bacterium]
MTELPAFQKIAHRGASGHCPENTRASLVRAIELGADMVEVDCQLTLDGAAVILHDERLDRTTNGRGPLRAKTLREVKELDAGSWFAPSFAGEQVPTLEEAIDVLAARVGMNLELKGDDDPGRLELVALGIVSQRGAFDRTVFSSFSAQRMRRLRQLSSNARIGVLIDCDGDWEAGLDFARALEAEALHPERSLVTPEGMRQAHAEGLEVRVWSVNAIDEAERLVRAGVDGIFTDFPDRLLRLEALRDRPRWI